MPDLNQILLFVACVSPLVVLVRTWKRAIFNRGWRLVALAVLGATAVAWWIDPGHAGFIGGGVWFLFLFLPAAGLHKAAELASDERYLSARRLFDLLRFLHPVRAVRDERALLRALELAQKGKSDEALQMLDAVGRGNSRVAVQAIAQTLRIRGDWEGLLAWCRRHLPLVALGRDPGLIPLYFRALGETSARDELVVQFAGRVPAMLVSPNLQSTFATTLMLTLAFSGRTAALTELLRRRLRNLPADTQQFWIGTSELAAGAIETGAARLQRLRSKTRDALLRAEIARRLDRASEPHLPLHPASEATLRRFERDVHDGRGSLLAGQRGPTPAVSILLGLNLAMFVAELSLGGSTNASTLQRLGALEPYAVLANSQYWRLLAALFLHYGAVHLAVNLYALYVLGPPLERLIGALRFAFSYIVAGLGSTAGVVALWRLQWTQADFLVGASGSVMGIVGAWAGWLLRHRHTPMARRRLATIGLIVIIQSAFDLYTPQISMAAHLCGLGTGLCVGLVTAPRRRE